MNPVTEFAKMLKERENPGIPGITTGTVIKPLPDMKIRLNDVIVLSVQHLYLSDHILNDLKTGDKVIIMPTVDEQTYYVLGKAVRL
ncbi:DUF2577 family protein [Caldifermentibacillus hisashii]|uniref:DUF2577 family protein n=1 Tax=Caldifermentibacillus hisashii TaxID=996558 RepID=A0ABU9JWK5_9BACI